jgi:hypothetical protein
VPTSSNVWRCYKIRNRRPFQVLGSRTYASDIGDALGLRTETFFSARSGDLESQEGDLSSKLSTSNQLAAVGSHRTQSILCHYPLYRALIHQRPSPALIRGYVPSLNPAVESYSTNHNSPVININPQVQAASTSRWPLRARVPTYVLSLCILARSDAGVQI